MHPFALGWRHCQKNYMRAKLITPTIKPRPSTPIHQHKTFNGLYCHFCDMPFNEEDDDDHEECEKEAMIEAEEVRRSDERSYYDAIRF